MIKSHRVGDRVELLDKHNRLIGEGEVQLVHHDPSGNHRYGVRIGWDQITMSTHQKMRKIPKKLPKMSFWMTTRQMYRFEKDVTRRSRWIHAPEKVKQYRTGWIIQAVEKGMGLKKGQKVKPIREIAIIKATREPLGLIREEHDGVAREGYPELSASGFIDMFIKHGQAKNEDEVITRLEFLHQAFCSKCEVEQFASMEDMAWSLENFADFFCYDHQEC